MTSGMDRPAAGIRACLTGVLVAAALFAAAAADADAAKLKPKITSIRCIQLCGGSTTVAPGGVTRLTPDAKSGRIAAAASPDGTTDSFGYDGALLTRLSWEGAVRGEVARKYDNDFRLQAL